MGRPRTFDTAHLVAVVQRSPGLTTAELAMRLGVSSVTVLRRVAEAGLRAERQGSGGRLSTRWYHSTAPEVVEEVDGDAIVLDRIWGLLRDLEVPEVGTLDQQVAWALGLRRCGYPVHEHQPEVP